MGKHTITLGERLPGRNNNLNLIRMIAASLVILSHSFPATQGHRAIEPLQLTTGYTLGGFCVAIFFFVSGLLITRSYERNGILEYNIARAFRLFPALFVVLVLTVVVLGPLVTKHSLGEYISNGITWSYIPRNLTLISLQYELPGVFSNNPYGGAINGSLWTLFYEVSWYIGVVIIGALGFFRNKKLFTIFAFCSIVIMAGAGYFCWVAGIDLERGGAYRIFNALRLGFPFVLGMTAYVFRNRVVLSVPISVAIWMMSAFVATVVPESAQIPLGFILTPAVSYTVLCLAYLPQGWTVRYNDVGDFSYGMYIYAFPVQQTLVYLLPGQSWRENAVLAFVFTLPLAILSWLIVEKPILAASKGVHAPASRWVSKVRAVRFTSD